MEGLHFRHLFGKPMVASMHVAGLVRHLVGHARQVEACGPLRPESVVNLGQTVSSSALRLHQATSPAEGMGLLENQCVRSRSYLALGSHFWPWHHFGETLTALQHYWAWVEATEFVGTRMSEGSHQGLVETWDQDVGFE